MSLNTKDRNNEKPQSWKGMCTNNFFSSQPSLREILLLGEKHLWRPEVLLQGNLPFLLCFTFPNKNKQQLR